MNTSELPAETGSGARIQVRICADALGFGIEDLREAARGLPAGPLADLWTSTATAMQVALDHAQDEHDRLVGGRRS